MTQGRWYRHGLLDVAELDPVRLEIFQLGLIETFVSYQEIHQTERANLGKCFDAEFGFIGKQHFPRSAFQEGSFQLGILKCV